MTPAYSGAMTSPPAEPEPSGHVPPPGGLRASHDEREAVVTWLRDAAAEGRIDLDELDERVERALKARTRADLAALTADLPQPRSAADEEPLVLKGGVHGASRGPAEWEVPGRIVARGGMGGVKIDFSRVRCALDEVTIEAYGEMGGVTIVLPDSWRADTNGIDPGPSGVRDRTTPERRPGTPLIRLTGYGGMAGVTVRHPSRRERRKLRADPSQPRLD